jgi:hypothetical protein
MRQSKEERTSFLEKKEAKKLLLNRATGRETSTVQISKSFLVLFFKKEPLTFLT